MSAQTVAVYVVVGSSSQATRPVDLGLFFRVTDANTHAARIGPREWSDVHVEPRQIALQDVHPAHVSMLTSEQQAAWKQLQSPAVQVGALP
jgi:hypothetical protein